LWSIELSVNRWRLPPLLLSHKHPPNISTNSFLPASGPPRISFFVSASSLSTFAAVLQVQETREREKERKSDNGQTSPLIHSLLGKDYMRCIGCGVVINTWKK
jgi:hypothetical protein